MHCLDMLLFGIDKSACRKQDILQYPDTSSAYLPRLISKLPSGTTLHLIGLSVLHLSMELVRP